MSERPSERITREVTSWPGVEAGPGRRGEFAFTVAGREIGHLHGDRAAHFGFPRDVGAELLAAGRGGPDPGNPHSTKKAAPGCCRPAESGRIRSTPTRRRWRRGGSRATTTSPR